MKRLVFALLLFGLISVPAFAQSGNSLAWDMPNTLAESQAYQYSWKVDADAPIVITVTCAQPATAVTCTTPIPVSVWTKLLVPGQHTIIITPKNTITGLSAVPSSYAPGTTTPGSPVNIRIVVTTTVTIGGQQ